MARRTDQELPYAGKTSNEGGEEDKLEPGTGERSIQIVEFLRVRRRTSFVTRFKMMMSSG